MNKLVKKWYCA